MGITSETKSCRQCGKPLSITQRSNALYCYDCGRERLKKARRGYAKRYAAEHKEEIAQYQRERRTWLIAHNMCVVCGSAKAIEGQTLCESCRKKARLQWKKCKQKKKA